MFAHCYWDDSGSRAFQDRDKWTGKYSRGWRVLMKEKGYGNTKEQETSIQELQSCREGKRTNLDRRYLGAKGSRQERKYHV